MEFQLIERLNREIRRRARVVGVFPNRASVFSLVGTLLMDVDDMLMKTGLVDEDIWLRKA